MFEFWDTWGSYLGLNSDLDEGFNLGKDLYEQNAILNHNDYNRGSGTGTPPGTNTNPGRHKNRGATGNGQTYGPRPGVATHNSPNGIGGNRGGIAGEELEQAGKFDDLLLGLGGLGMLFKGQQGSMAYKKRQANKPIMTTTRGSFGFQKGSYVDPIIPNNVNAEFSATLPQVTVTGEVGDNERFRPVQPIQVPQQEQAEEKMLGGAAILKKLNEIKKQQDLSMQEVPFIKKMEQAGENAKTDKTSQILKNMAQKQMKEAAMMSMSEEEKAYYNFFKNESRNESIAPQAPQFQQGGFISESPLSAFLKKKHINNVPKFQNSGTVPDLGFGQNFPPITYTANLNNVNRYGEQFENMRTMNARDWISNRINSPVAFDKIRAIDKERYKRELFNRFLNTKQRRKKEYIANQILENNPQGNADRVSYLNSLQNQEENLLKGQRPEFQTSYWDDFVTGVRALNSNPMTTGLSNIVKNPGLTDSEISQKIEEREGSPVTSRASDALGILSPLSIPSKGVQSLYRDEYSLMDALQGRKNKASFGEDLVTDIAAYGGIGLLSKLGKANRFRKILNPSAEIYRRNPELRMAGYSPSSKSNIEHLRKTIKRHEQALKEIDGPGRDFLSRSRPQVEQYLQDAKLKLKKAIREKSKVKPKSKPKPKKDKVEPEKETGYFGRGYYLYDGQIQSTEKSIKQLKKFLKEDDDWMAEHYKKQLQNDKDRLEFFKKKKSELSPSDPKSKKMKEFSSGIKWDEWNNRSRIGKKAIEKYKNLKKERKKIIEEVNSWEKQPDGSYIDPQGRKRSSADHTERMFYEEVDFMRADRNMRKLVDELKLRKEYDSIPFEDAAKERKKYDTELEWEKWNKRTPYNKKRMEEYVEIEKRTKADGTWMKNSDGSKFEGTNVNYRNKDTEKNPMTSDDLTGEEATKMQFVQQQSSEYKEAMKNMEVGYHGSRNTFSSFYSKNVRNGRIYGDGIYTAPDIDKLAGYADFGDKQKYHFYQNISNEQPAGLSKKLKKDYDFFRPTPSINIVPFSNYPKSAIGNDGGFLMSNPNMYRSMSPLMAYFMYQQLQKDNQKSKQ